MAIVGDVLHSRVARSLGAGSGTRRRECSCSSRRPRSSRAGSRRSGAMFRRTSVRSATRTRSTYSACRLSGWAPGKPSCRRSRVQRALRGHPRARALGPGGAASGADRSWSGDRSAGRRLRCRSSPTRCEQGSSCEWRCSTTWSCSDLSATAGKGERPGEPGGFLGAHRSPGGGVILAGRNGHPDSLTLEGRVVSPTRYRRITPDHGHGQGSNDPEPGGVRATVIAPAFVDPHVHLRTPGREDEETLRSGTEAAAAGRFCAILAMPNTDPVVDSAAVLRRPRRACARGVSRSDGFHGRHQHGAAWGGS